MKDEKKKSGDPTEDIFGEPISVYTTEQAIEDGLFFDAGRLLNRRIVLTANLLATLEKESLVSALVTGLSEAMKFSRPDLAVYTVAGKKIYVDDNTETITIMLAEDY